VALPSNMKRTGCSRRIGTVEGCGDRRADQLATTLTIWANPSTCSTYCLSASGAGWTKSVDRWFSQEKTEEVVHKLNSSSH
jgi:hypothetical protein